MPAVVTDLLPLSPLPNSAFYPEPDLHPLYPTAAYLDPFLSPSSGLSPGQKHELVQHSLHRACTFADLPLLIYLLGDSHPRSYIDLGVEDEDGMGFVTITIQGFGAETERDVDREECVRLLVAEGADLGVPDKAGWTPLHHAALLCPPTLVSFFLTHGCSPLTLTRRGLTPLDILTAHSMIPGRDAVALLLEEAMREQGWTGGRMEQRRRQTEERARRQNHRQIVRQHVGRVLGLNDRWWGEDSLEDDESDDSSMDIDDIDNEDASNTLGMPYSPPTNFTTMLVFSPSTLDTILDSLTYRATPTLRCAEPARALYLLARFACLACDDTWLEDLMGGATDRIERLIFAKPDDLTLQTFWLYNTTALLHFLRCDTRISDICDLLDLSSLLEGVIKAIYVFIIRITERQMDPLLDTVLLDHTPLSSEFDNLHFEDEWSIFRPFASSGTKLTKKKHDSNTGRNSSSNSRPPSPSPMSPSFAGGIYSGSSSRFSWTQSLTRSRATSVAPTLLNTDSQSPKPQDITVQLEALHTLLSLAGINPALITQIYSQVLYWSACELFNRILTRKKYLCRSRALQIGMNLGVIEEWVVSSGLPQGVETHFAPVRELLHWLQGLSSIGEFQTLVETIQTMKYVNPLQMRRAVRDYRYEVSETRMSEECTQYLVQLQKDWERRRVRLGVEALRREMAEHEHDRESSVASTPNEASDSASHDASVSIMSEQSQVRPGIDVLFLRDHERAEWSAPRPPEPLGELRDSRYMLPLVFPTNPRFLATVTRIPKEPARKPKRESLMQTPHGQMSFLEREKERPSSRASVAGRGAMEWKSHAGALRRVGIETLEWVDGVRGQGKWAGMVNVCPPNEEEMEDLTENVNGNGNAHPTDSVLTEKPRRKVSRHVDSVEHLNEGEIPVLDGQLET